MPQGLFGRIARLLRFDASPDFSTESVAVRIGASEPCFATIENSLRLLRTLAKVENSYDVWGLFTTVVLSTLRMLRHSFDDLSMLFSLSFSLKGFYRVSKGVAMLLAPIGSPRRIRLVPPAKLPSKMTFKITFEEP